MHWFLCEQYRVRIAIVFSLVWGLGGPFCGIFLAPKLSVCICGWYGPRHVNGTECNKGFLRMSFAEFSKYLLKVLNWLRNIRSICYIGVYFVCFWLLQRSMCLDIMSPFLPQRATIMKLITTTGTRKLRLLPQPNPVVSLFRPRLFKPRLHHA